MGKVVKLISDAGLILITPFILPFRPERNMVSQMMEPGDFVEVFINTSLHVAEKRDAKGLYTRSSDEIKSFTSIKFPYETKEHRDPHPYKQNGYR